MRTYLKLFITTLLLTATALPAYRPNEDTSVYPISPIEEEECANPLPPLDISTLIDANFSMYSGTENLHSAYRVYDYLDEQLFCSWSILTSNSWAGRLARLTKGILLDFPVRQMLVVTQHEVFGHGARAREFHVDHSYKFYAPFPYGEGGAQTLLNAAEFNSRRPLERAAIITGGVESTELLGRRVALNALRTGCLTTRDSRFYMDTFHDQSGYILSLVGEIIDRPGHDIKTYRNTVNTFYGQEEVNLSRLKKLAWMNFLDGMTLVSIYHNWASLWNGETCRELPTLGCGRAQILPGFRLTLAPYGPEVGVHSYFRVEDKVGFVYARHGKNGDVRSYGIGMEIDNYLTYYDWTLGFKADIWKQPSYKSLTPAADADFGGLFLVKGNYCWTDRVSFLVELGGKSSGFVPGEELGGAVIARAGMNISIF